MTKGDALDKLDSALLSVMRLAKKPAYWDEFQRKADIQIDRPAAAIVMMLSEHTLQFQEVVNKLGVEAPSISRKVHELESLKLIRREPMADKRVHMLALSSEGIALSRKIKSARREMLDQLLVAWTAEDTELLSQLLTRLALDFSSRYASKT